MFRWVAGSRPKELTNGTFVHWMGVSLWVYVSFIKVSSVLQYIPYIFTLTKQETASSLDLALKCLPDFSNEYLGKKKDWRRIQPNSLAFQRSLQASSALFFIDLRSMASPRKTIAFPPLLTLTPMYVNRTTFLSWPGMCDAILFFQRNDDAL